MPWPIDHSDLHVVVRTLDDDIDTSAGKRARSHSTVRASQTCGSIEDVLRGDMLCVSQGREENGGAARPHRLKSTATLEVHVTQAQAPAGV
jgi:hypothetical protein